MSEQRTLIGRLYGLYEAAESHVSTAAESLVGSEYFAKLFATSVSNAMALARVANRGLDRGVHASRLAGRTDVASVGHQLARTEDKLEQVLQMVEAQQGRLDAIQARFGDAATPPAGLNGAATTPARRAAPAAPLRPATAAGRTPAVSGSRPAAKRASAPNRRRTP
jgi:hypothetical protein